MPRPPSRAAAPRMASPGRSARRPSGWARPASRCGRRHAGEQARASRSTSLSKRGDTSWIEASSRRSGGRSHGCLCATDGRALASPLKKLHLNSPASAGFSAADADRRRLRFLRARRRRRSHLCRRQAQGRGALRPRDDRHRARRARRGRCERGPARSWSRSPRRCCRSTAAIAISTTKRRCTRCSTRGGPTMSKPRRPGRARPWSGAGRARRPARWSCMPIRWRLMPIAGSAALRRPRPSTAGSAGSGAICAGSVECSTGRLRQRPSLPERLRAGGVGRTPKPSAMGVEGGLFSPALRSPGVRAAALARLASMPAHPARRHRPLLGREALGHGHPRGRRALARAHGRAAPRRRRAERAQLELLADRSHGRRCCRSSPTATSWRACSPVPTRWSTAARPRPSAWSRPRRGRAAFR